MALEHNKTHDVHMVGLVWQSASAVVGDVVQHKQAIAALAVLHVGWHLVAACSCVTVCMCVAGRAAFIAFDLLASDAYCVF